MQVYILTMSAAKNILKDANIVVVAVKSCCLI